MYSSPKTAEKKYNFHVEKSKMSSDFFGPKIFQNFAKTIPKNKLLKNKFLRLLYNHSHLRSWIAVTTFNSIFMIYATNSGRLQFELTLDSPASFLHLHENYCLVGLTNGTITTWYVLTLYGLFYGKVLSDFYCKIFSRL